MNHPHQENAKKSIINNIKNETFCKLGASSISGVGIIAIKDIPKGTEIFKCCNDQFFKHDKPVEISVDELSEVEDSVLEHMKNFCGQSRPNVYPIPFKGLNSMSLMFYLNHSDEPNTEFCFKEKGLDDFVTFVTSKNVPEGEELTQDYNNLSRDRARLLEQFPFLRK